MKTSKNVCFGLLVGTVLCIGATQVRGGYPDPQDGGYGCYGENRRQANMLMLRFQDALGTERWQAALAFCSDRIRAKAAESASAEAFFRQTMPLEKVLTQDFGCWYCGSNFFGLVINLNLTKGGVEPAIQWYWAICATNGAWVVDYPPVSLNDYIAKKKAAIQAREDKIKQIRQNLEPKLRGIKTHLTPVSERFVIGPPMLFRMEVINFGNAPLHFEDSGVAYHSLTVLNETRETIPTHVEPLQIVVKHGELAAGSSAILASNIDISRDHNITKPGKYFVQFDGACLDIGESVPPMEPGCFGENEGLWPMNFVPVLTKLPSEIIEIEVIDTLRAKAGMSFPL
jgi:hypothetical protein